MRVVIKSVYISSRLKESVSQAIAVKRDLKIFSSDISPNGLAIGEFGVHAVGQQGLILSSP